MIAQDVTTNCRDGDELVSVLDHYEIKEYNLAFKATEHSGSGGLCLPITHAQSFRIGEEAKKNGFKVFVHMSYGRALLEVANSESPAFEPLYRRFR